MKVKYILALILVLVAGLIVGFFIGFGITNKDLDIDWKAISPVVSSVIAATVAIYISNKWSKPKGGEIIADESKQVIKDTLEMVKIINYIGSSSFKKDDLKDLEVFKKLFESVVINTAFIEDSIIDNDLKISFSLFSKKSIPINRMISDQKIKVGNTNLSPLISEFNEAAIGLVNVLNPYSIYRKSCKFKKNSHKISPNQS